MQPGFTRVLGWSLAAHVTIIALALFAVGGEPRRIFYAPVYTVDIVDIRELRPEPRRVEPKKAAKKKKTVKKAVKKKAAPKKAGARKKAKKKAVVKKRARAEKKVKTAAKPAAKAPVRAKEAKPEKAPKAEPPKPKPPKAEPRKAEPRKAEPRKPETGKAEPRKETAEAVKERPAGEVSIEQTLAMIERRVREKEARELVAARVAEIEKKYRADEEARKKELGAIRSEIEELGRRKARQEEQADAARMRAEIEALRKSLAARAEAAARQERTVEIETRTEPAPARRAAGRLSRELLELRFKAYYNDVREKIKENWIYPGTEDSGLETWVSIRIDRDGRVTKSWIEKGSGSQLFDDSTLKAVTKAAPFEPLPEGMDSDFLEIGIRFCPGGCAGG
ncbi:MAG TPA: cell envelope integrity protein TolA [Deltaproteobacteria bacterium]|nr:cell envelope integrity protein TolA [Deltaproteobacteria bacterium]